MAADQPFSQMLKQGLRFSLGAAILTGLFAHRGDLLDNYVYPVFGYVSVVIEPSSGRAITAGLGRLGGSALGGIIAAVLLQAFGLEGSGQYVIPALTFMLAAVICETYRWQAAYSQATLLGTLIAMRAVGTSGQEDIWLYVRDRLIDNWIGIMVGFMVVLLFWPQSSRTELIKLLRQFLQQVPLVLQAVIRPASQGEAVAPPATTQIAQLTKLTQTGQKINAAARTEFQAEALMAENWSDILSSQAQIVRQLNSMATLLPPESHPLAAQLHEELTQFVDQVARICDRLSLQPDPGDPDISTLHQLQSRMETRLEELRSTGEIAAYDVSQVLQCFQLLELCRHLTQSLQTLHTQLHQRAVVNYERQSLITWPQWTPISASRLLQIVGLGTAVGLNLAILHQFDFPFPSAYEKVASLILVGVLIMLVQPTRGKAIAAGVAGTLFVYVTLFIIYLVTRSFGFTVFSSALVYFLIYMTCASVGLTPLARIGAIIAAVVFTKDIGLFFDQALKAALIAMPVSVFIAVLITSLFMGGSESEQFNQSLSQTYRQLGQLYQALMRRYLQGQDTDAEVAQYLQTITATLAKHPKAFKIAGLEQGTSALAAEQKRRWQRWLSQEQPLFTQLNTLSEQSQTPLPDWVRQQFLPELEAIAQQTADSFDQIANQISGVTTQSHPPTQQLAALEQQLLNLRASSRDYPLLPLISFSAAFVTLKAITANLDQLS
ncbi:MAG: FUSC family protein [Scytolyngbya sp. HA4215-MV1]|jgi:uncharacterized membrane protein YccC|nr:FUSC family protein [Scytolyngbya sp. HA4215-MV1]